MSSVCSVSAPHVADMIFPSCTSFHTSLPPLAMTGSSTPSKDPRTFCLLPGAPEARPFFAPNTNTRAADEIAAHVEMFTDSSDGMYTLGAETDRLIRDWLDEARKRERAAAGK